MGQNKRTASENGRIDAVDSGVNASHKQDEEHFDADLGEKCLSDP